MIWISATPSMVDIRGRITRSRYSVTCSWVMFGLSGREVHQRELHAGALDDHRVVGVVGELAAHALHLREHLGQRHVGVGRRASC